MIKKKKKAGLVFEQLMMGMMGAPTSSIATAEPEQPDGFLEGKFQMKGTRGKRGVEFFVSDYCNAGCQVKHLHSRIRARFVPTAVLCCFFIHVFFLSRFYG